MIITSIQISQLRNIIDAKIQCAPRFNLFFGDNAAGKTSVLEAIYYLSAGKSFRTHHHDRVIHHAEDQLTIFTQLNVANTSIHIGLQRHRDSSLHIRINEESVRSISDVSFQLPVLFISSDSHRLLSDGPKARRHFLDWGLFHANPLFFSHWKSFQKILNHRNAALKSRASRDELLIWNNQFAQAGEVLDRLRKAYLDDFSPFFNEIMRVLLDDAPVSLEYYSGWDKNTPLEPYLNQNVSRETLAGHSLFGPQRADLILTVQNGHPAEDTLSQGQQKLVSYALRLSQGLHLQSTTEKTPIYLIDDLPSELDSDKRRLVTEILAKINAQVFITGIESEDLREIMSLETNNRMFHVKHGMIAVDSDE